jgi:hypothetical protein
VPSPLDSIHIWINAFRSIWIACGTINTGAKTMEWNAFASTKVTDLLPGQASQSNFVIAVVKQFNISGLSSYPVTGLIGPKDTFADFTNGTVGYLSYSVFDMVQGVCPPACFNEQGSLLVATTLDLAFPAGAADANWTILLNEVKASNLDNLLASTAVTDASAVLAKGKKATVADLINTFSKL